VTTMKAADMEPYRLVARPGVSITAESAAALKLRCHCFIVKTSIWKKPIRAWQSA
jgi:hypothetical protein